MRCKLCDQTEVALNMRTGRREPVGIGVHAVAIQCSRCTRMMLKHSDRTEEKDGLHNM